jgi:hypothetical protein
LANYNDPAWHLFASFWLINEPGNQHLAAERVVAVVRELDWAMSSLAQIKQAVCRAAQSALDRAPIGSPLLVRLFLQVERDAFVSVPRVAKAERGWGFFLVQREEEGPALPAGAQYNVVELFLYRE